MGSTKIQTGIPESQKQFTKTRLGVARAARRDLTKPRSDPPYPTSDPPHENHHATNFNCPLEPITQRRIRIALCCGTSMRRGAPPRKRRGAVVPFIVAAGGRRPQLPSWGSSSFVLCFAALFGRRN